MVMDSGQASFSWFWCGILIEKLGLQLVSHAVLRVGIQI